MKATTKSERQKGEFQESKDDRRWFFGVNKILRGWTNGGLFLNERG